MNIKLNKEQFEYLQKELPKTELDLYYRLSLKKLMGDKFLLEMEDDDLFLISEWASDQLLLIGFDENYELTKEGQMLEDLIDLFY